MTSSAMLHLRKAALRPAADTAASADRAEELTVSLTGRAAAIRNSILKAEKIWTTSCAAYSETDLAEALPEEHPRYIRRILEQRFPEQWFPQRRHKRQQLRRIWVRRLPDEGEDLHADINVTFDEAVLGGTKRIHLRGSDGKEQSLDIKIPAGIESGKSIRLKGKGMPGSGGGEPGDLLLKVTVQEKPGFRREGMDIYTTVRIPYTTAVFGGEARIHTVYGDVVCKIKEGTQPGTKLRLRGKGAASVSNPSVRGDQYAVIEIQIPQNMGPEARKKLREYEQALKREQLHRTSAA